MLLLGIIKVCVLAFVASLTIVLIAVQFLPREKSNARYWNN
jgi:hypothetical protein